MTGMVSFVGAGPGDPGLLTLKGKAVIERADVIIYAGSLVNPEVLAFARSDARIVDSARMNLDDIVGEMISSVRKGQTVARVHSGDPSLYGAIGEQLERLEREGICCEVVPGVSSVFAAAAAMKLEYTLPGVTQTLVLTRRAGRTAVPEKESLPLLAGHRASMAIFLSAGMIDTTVEELVSGGYPPETPAAVVYRASWPDEKCIQGTLATIAQRAQAEGITRQALILVGDAVARRTREPSRLYAPDFGHGFRNAEGSSGQGTAVIAVSRRGWHTGRRVKKALEGAELFVPERFREEEREGRVTFYESLQDTVESAFGTFGDIVLVMATGIAVRMIAPLIRSKWEDPAVVTLDDGGRNIISLLSGHWGGANDLALKLAQILGGNPVITTESDVMGFPSLDLLVKILTAGAVPGRAAALKHIQSDILEGKDVGFYPRQLRRFPGMRGHPNLHFFDSVEALACSGCTAGFMVSHHAGLPVPVHERMLLVHPRTLVVGIGCHKGISPDELQEGVCTVFHDLNLAVSSIALLCSIDIKRDEQGLIEFAKRLKLPLEFFTPEEINQVKIASPVSAHTLQIMGVHGVAEPCAILGAGGGKLLKHKVKLKNMTIAVAKLPLEKLLENSEEATDE